MEKRRRKSPDTVIVRAFGLKNENRLRDLDPMDIDKLVMIKGMVTRVTAATPKRGLQSAQSATLSAKSAGASRPAFTTRRHREGGFVAIAKSVHVSQRVVIAAASGGEVRFQTHWHRHRTHRRAVTASLRAVFRVYPPTGFWSTFTLANGTRAPQRSRSFS